jgi:hypothetical protein
MCAAEQQLKSDTANVYELTMNFTSGLGGGAQDYQVRLILLEVSCAADVQFR